MGGAGSSKHRTQRLADVFRIHAAVDPTRDDARTTAQRGANKVPGLKAADAAAALVPHMEASGGESQPKNTRLPTIVRRNG